MMGERSGVGKDRIQVIEYEYRIWTWLKKEIHIWKCTCIQAYNLTCTCGCGPTEKKSTKVFIFASTGL